MRRRRRRKRRRRRRRRRRKRRRRRRRRRKSRKSKEELEEEEEEEEEKHEEQGRAGGGGRRSKERNANIHMTKTRMHRTWLTLFFFPSPLLLPLPPLSPPKQLCFISSLSHSLSMCCHLSLLLAQFALSTSLSIHSPTHPPTQGVPKVPLPFFLTFHPPTHPPTHSREVVLRSSLPPSSSTHPPTHPSQLELPHSRRGQLRLSSPI